jgi:hypothetical protein
LRNRARTRCAEGGHLNQEGRAQGQETRRGGSRRAHQGTQSRQGRAERRQGCAAKAKPSKTTKAAKKATKATPPRESSKKAIVLEMLRAKGGATMAAIAKETGWQNHTIRGFISGTLSKKMGLAIESTRSESGDRTYRITGK